ncbi:MAG: DUF3862 domain-containing protein [Gammaproteobacteria bacterium]|nr:DUF3862 domain-containing protein [Gammaproteobacteria bacterium]
MNRITKLLVTLVLALVLVSCTSSINKKNFDLIESGMTYPEVVAILGEPSTSATLSLGDSTGTSTYWENRNGKISIQFINGRVKIKQFVEGVTTPREEW